MNKKNTRRHRLKKKTLERCYHTESGRGNRSYDESGKKVAIEGEPSISVGVPHPKGERLDGKGGQTCRNLRAINNKRARRCKEKLHSRMPGRGQLSKRKKPVCNNSRKKGGV